MAWVKLSDDTPDHPMMAAVGAAAFGFFVNALCYSNRQLTDGFVPDSVARRLVLPEDQPEILIQRLLDAGAMARAVRDGIDGFMLAARYVADQPTREVVERDRAAAKLRKEAWTERKKNKRGTQKERRSNGAGTLGERQRNTPPDPDPDPDPERSEDQERSRRAGARIFTGTRLKVTEAQHGLVMDESGLDDDALRALYPEWDAELVASGETFDTLVYVKRRAQEMRERPQSILVVPTVDWFEECQRLHGGDCGLSSLRHRNRLLLDAAKVANA